MKYNKLELFNVGGETRQELEARRSRNRSKSKLRSATRKINKISNPKRNRYGGEIGGLGDVVNAAVKDSSLSDAIDARIPSKEGAVAHMSLVGFLTGGVEMTSIENIDSMADKAMQVSKSIDKLYSDPQRTSSDPQRRSSDPQRRSSDPQRRSSDPQRRSSVPQRRSSVPQRRSSDPQRRSSVPQRRNQSYENFMVGAPVRRVRVQNQMVAEITPEITPATRTSRRKLKRAVGAARVVAHMKGAVQKSYDEWKEAYSFKDVQYNDEGTEGFDAPIDTRDALQIKDLQTRKYGGVIKIQTMLIIADGFTEFINKAAGITTKISNGVAWMMGSDGEKIKKLTVSMSELIIELFQSMKWIAICNTIMCQSEIYSMEEDTDKSTVTDLDKQWVYMIFNKMGYSNRIEMKNTHLVLQTLYIEMKKQLVLIGLDDCNLNLILKLSGTKEQYLSKKEDADPDPEPVAEEAVEPDEDADAVEAEAEDKIAGSATKGSISDKIKNTQIIIANECKKNIKAIEKLSKIYNDNAISSETLTTPYNIAHKFHVRDGIHLKNLEVMHEILSKRYGINTKEALKSSRVADGGEVGDGGGGGEVAGGGGGGTTADRSWGEAFVDSAKTLTGAGYGN